MKTRQRRKWTILGIMAGACVLPLTGACGDAPTEDDRGYTKAPLEEPGVFVEPETRTEMDRLGEPNLIIEPGVDSAGAAGEEAPVEAEATE